MPTIYVVKYAATQGIIEIDAEILDTGMALVRGTRGESGITFDTYYRKGEWTFGIQRARRMALEKIEAKRKSLMKQLKKLDEITSEIQRESVCMMNGCCSGCA